MKPKKKEFTPFICWIFDCNRRVYKRDENNRTYGGPIWREHWIETKIIGETSKYWITEVGRRINKSDDSAICFSLINLNQKIWIHENRYKLSELVRHEISYEKLNAIAEILEKKELDTNTNKNNTI